MREFSYRFMQGVFSMIPDFKKRMDAERNLRRFDEGIPISKIEEDAQKLGALYAKMLKFITNSNTSSVEEVYREWELGCLTAGVVPEVISREEELIKVAHKSCIPYECFYTAYKPSFSPEEILPCRYSCIPLVQEFTRKISGGNLEVKVEKEPSINNMCIKVLQRTNS